MNYESEFATVNLILASEAETRGVDAFAIALIKCERQIRKIFTNTVFQFPCFADTDVRALREALSNDKNVYFEGFIRGFDALYRCPIRELFGKNYEILMPRINEAITHRNKIFHGQLTKKYITREVLLSYVTDIRTWCHNLSSVMLLETGYDGFARGSYRKAANTEIWKTYKTQFKGIDCYSNFIRHEMGRSRNMHKDKATTTTKPPPQ